MQLTDRWDELYQTNTTAWEDDEVAPATQHLIRAHLLPGHSVLEIGCGRGVDSVWLAEQGYQVVACDISPTAIRDAEERARRHGMKIDFRVADVLHEHTSLPRCHAVFERGVFHTFTTDAGRSRFAQVIAELLGPGQSWLSLAGLASTPEEAAEAAARLEARVSASQVARAVEPYFDVVSMTRTIYGFPRGRTDFPAVASVLRRRA
jgi:cyclopropane fatty-acyl-phospholipid synthase-like methyltransferase